MNFDQRLELRTPSLMSESSIVMMKRWFGSRSPARAPADRAVGRDDVVLAYRLVLGRDPDEDGLRRYTAAAGNGLSLRALLDDLLASEEFRDHRSSGSMPAVVRPVRGVTGSADLIDPQDVIRRYTLEELNETADEYYRRVTDPTPLMSKPFAYWHEAPQMLHDLGLLLGGMRMGKAMTVLDFGAGTGWLTRILAQLHCEVVACDVSSSALDIGRQLFKNHRPVGGETIPPTFMTFDGRRLALSDHSVDRIVCFDAFHHVPNPDEVIAEFGRVLKDGGIAGFSEPGRHHSRSPQSQYEMRHHRVLENDIDLNAIFAKASQAGFTALSVRALSDLEISLDDYNVVFGGGDQQGLRSRAWDSMRDAMVNRSVFFLHKGQPRRDSRSHEGLAHEMAVDRSELTMRAGALVPLTFTIANTGDASWLSEGRQIFGLVRLASHLATDDGRMLEVDFSREPLPRVVEPGESIEMTVRLMLPDPGRYRLTFDLVAEGVTWFENVGSTPVQVRAVVE
jgi:SAM-dependent methyltransferase